MSASPRRGALGFFLFCERLERQGRTSEIQASKRSHTSLPICVLDSRPSRLKPTPHSSRGGSAWCVRGRKKSLAVQPFERFWVPVGPVLWWGIRLDAGR